MIEFYQLYMLAQPYERQKRNDYGRRDHPSRRLARAYRALKYYLLGALSENWQKSAKQNLRNRLFLCNNIVSVIITSVSRSGDLTLAMPSRK